MKKKYLLVSYWSYPFGGGEEFLYQTADWFLKLHNAECYWMVFSQADNKEFTNFSVTTLQNGTILIWIQNGMQLQTLVNWFRLIKPDLIHTQGHHKLVIAKAASQLRIPILVGYHFWNGLIELDTNYYNEDILKHIDLHKESHEYQEITELSNSSVYLASDFMACVVKKVLHQDCNVLFPSSNVDKCLAKEGYSPNRQFITQINIHRLKGGAILKELLQKLPDYIQFQCIQTEPCSELLDSEISQLIENRSGSLLIKRTENMKLVYSNTRILLIPSLVDETFCRVANEGLMNGIPIVTTGAGNIKLMIEDAAIILDKNDDWVSVIERLWNDKQALQKYSEMSKKRYEKVSETIAINTFEKLTTKLLVNSKNNNIGIFAPYCDQGLGLQSRNYLHALTDLGLHVYIFSYRPYTVPEQQTSKALQKNQEEWPGTVWYSTNNREETTDKEIQKFVEMYNIGKMIIPETCWFRVFEIAKLLRSLNVITIAIPNIEIVRKDELFKHKYFDIIACNNRLCEKLLQPTHPRVYYLGYSIVDPIVTQLTKKNSRTITFLLVGGLNAFTRKQVIEVCQAFRLTNNKNLQLTVTIQGNFSTLIQEFTSAPNIKIITDHLSYQQIINLYNETDVSIQVSKKEGLGLGFYEALSIGKPVVTLDTPPHNEIINPEIGWLVDCYHRPMTDNPQALFGDALFTLENFASVIQSITQQDLLLKKGKIPKYLENINTRFKKNLQNIFI